MSVVALIVAAALAAEPPTLRPACRNGLFGSDDSPTFVSLDNYPRAKLARPLTLPRFAWSVSAAGVYSGNLAPGFSSHGGGVVLGASTSPVCNVEVSVQTSHVFAPSPHPLSAVQPQLVVALTRSVALAATAHVQVQPSPGGLQAVVGFLGVPLRFPLTSWLGLVGMEQVLGFELHWGPPISTQLVPVVTLPVGLLVQPAAFLSIDVRARPKGTFNSLSLWRLDLESEVTVAPRSWIDLVAAVWVGVAPVGSMTASVGVRFRL